MVTLEHFQGCETFEGLFVTTSEGADVGQGTRKSEEGPKLCLKPIIKYKCTVKKCNVTIQNA